MKVTPHVNEYDHVSTAQLCQMLHISKDTALAWHHEGRLSAIRVGNKFLFKRAQVEAMLKGSKS